MKRLITVVSTCVNGEFNSAVYLNGKLQKRFDQNDAYEIARITKSKPCRVVTRNLRRYEKPFPRLLSDLPEEK